MASLIRARPLVALGTVLLSGCAVSPTGGAAGPAAVATPCPVTPGQQVLEQVNAIREEHGLRRVTVDARLVAAARAHTEDQARRGPSGVGHIGSDGSAPGDRVAAAGYDWRLVAENVAGGVPSAPRVVAGWMGSPPHRATILSPEAVHAGVGYVERYSRGMGHYWTLVVAAPRGGGSGDARSCHP